MIFQISDEAKDALIYSAASAGAKWSLKEQAVATAEELCELSVKLLQYGLSKVRVNLEADIKEEVVDCYIMLQQMASEFFDGSGEFEALLLKKMNKQQSKIEGMPR